jgi:hypothetical protein
MWHVAVPACGRSSEQVSDQVMGWWIIVLFIAGGLAVFMRTYRRRLEVLTGPWILSELSQND